MSGHSTTGLCITPFVLWDEDRHGRVWGWWNGGGVGGIMGVGGTDGVEMKYWSMLLRTIKSIIHVGLIIASLIICVVSLSKVRVSSL